LLDEAVRQASQLKDVENFIAKHSRKIKGYLVEKGYSEEDAENLSKIRVFSARPGSYGTKVEDLIPASSLWESDEDVADVFINFVSFGYGKGVWGKSLKSVYKKNLENVKVAMHSRSSNLFGVLDVDGVYGSLGALSLAVKRVGGEYPDVVLSIQGDPETAHIEDIERTIGEELRARYLNPKWIEGMKKENYAGAWQMNKFVEYMWGHQVTIPFAIDETKWEQVYDVYIEDKYGMDLKEFFNKENPWAYQSITARMLEAVRKEYWKPDEKITRKLSAEYALNVVEKGVACCDHTCNNPALNQMVVNIISLPGMLSPEMVERFKLAIEKAAAKPLDQQVEDRKNLLTKLNPGIDKTEQEKTSDTAQKESNETGAAKPDADKLVEGYKMEDVNTKDETTDLTSSGIQWAVSIFVLLLLGLSVFGFLQKRKGK
jgi:cobaltochelatase CobN